MVWIFKALVRGALRACDQGMKYGQWMHLVRNIQAHRMMVGLRFASEPERALFQRQIVKLLRQWDVRI